ncbi:MAG: hypothetical protein M1840_008133 [Geoglossum simile]|nr:MAG: hypothetical protein M1840_008133 [Geoglossum simile]
MLRWRPWAVDIVVYDEDLDREKRLSYDHIDERHFGWLTVFVAGAGFLTDIYDIVAGNVALPMLAIVYWGGEIPPHEKRGINLAPLIGALVGPITFGVLADRYGRKGVYGIVLIVMMAATLGLALSSRGVGGSVNILPWLVVWRLILGFGIGGDFPLSAAITAEFAPRKHRARMLAAVFLMKPVGEILAHVVAIIAISKSRRHISPGPEDCTGECLRATDSIWRWVVGIGAILPVGALILRLQIPESVRYALEVEKDIPTATGYRAATQPMEQDTGQSTSGGQPPSFLWENGSYSYRPQGSRTSDPPELHQHDGQSENRSISSNRDSVEQAGQNERRRVRKETWGEFWTGFRIFLFTDRWRDSHWEGSWTDLAGTSLTWMLLDFSFYFVGVYNPEFLSILWRSPKQHTPVYSMLMQYGWQALISNSIGALVGGAIFVAMARYRYNIQLYGFLILAVFFVVVGVSLLTLSSGPYFSAIIVFHGFCRLFFNLGPNPTVFIIPAEVFPTKYRCTCHGISAAAGKLGSILAQLVATSSRANPAWLGKIIVILTICNISGAVLTKLWVPNPCDINGKSRNLEDLSKGKSGRKALEVRELEERQPPAREGGAID